jgi:iron complex transport system substrate-binding protein
MSAVAWANVGAFAITLVASTAVAWAPLLRTQVVESAGDAAVGPPPVTLRDHSGTVVRVRDFERIVSASTVADALLLDLCEPDRIAAFTARSARATVSGYRYAGKPAIDLSHVEGVLALHPDLVLVNVVGDPHRVARLRDAGVVVFDLGEMRGLSTLIPNIRDVSALVGHPERGERFVRELLERMNAVAADIPPAARKTGVYLSIYGGRPFGGAAGTSYHDVLVAAGLVDAAADARDWPQYTAEQILEMDPQVIVTHDGMRQSLCQHAGFAMLRACQRPGGVVEVDDTLLGDPGPSMAQAAQAVRDRVYGPPAGPVVSGIARP